MIYWIFTLTKIASNICFSWKNEDIFQRNFYFPNNTFIKKIFWNYIWLILAQLSYFLSGKSYFEHKPLPTKMKKKNISNLSYFQLKFSDATASSSESLFASWMQNPFISRKKKCRRKYFYFMYNILSSQLFTFREREFNTVDYLLFYSIIYYYFDYLLSIIYY